MSRTLIRLAAALFLTLGMGPPPGAQVANGFQSGGSPPSAAERAAIGQSNAALCLSDYCILATTRVSTMERELNDAATEGFRLEIVGDDIDSGEGAVDEIFALVMRDARPDRFSYRLVTLKDLSTAEEELAQALTVAAAEGFIYRGLIQAPLGGHAVVVLEHDADTEAARLEYLVLATARMATLERELAEAASLGYRVMGLTMNGGGAFDSNDKIAVLARSHPAHAPEVP